MHHRFYRDLLRAKGYYDIFLFDTTGELIYSVYKELDYATNFVSGQYAQSGLGKAFQAAMAQPDAVHVIDFEPYAPRHGALASFISTGVRGAEEKIVGVLSFQVSRDPIDITFPAIGGEICLFDSQIPQGDLAKLSEMVEFSNASCSRWSPCPDADRCFCSYYFNQYSCLDLLIENSTRTDTAWCEDRKGKSILGTTCAETQPYCGKSGEFWLSPPQTNAQACPVTCGMCSPLSPPSKGTFPPELDLQQYERLNVQKQFLRDVRQFAGDKAQQADPGPFRLFGELEAIASWWKIPHFRASRFPRQPPIILPTQ